MKIRTLLITGLCLLAAGRGNVAHADVVHLQRMPQGVVARLGQQRPLSLQLSPRAPENLKKAPGGLVSPWYGVLNLGPKESPTHILVLADDLDGPMPRVWVDANNDGDLTNDPAVDWTKSSYKGAKDVRYDKLEGGATVSIRYGAQTLPLRIGFLRYDAADPTRGASRNALLYYADYGYAGDLTLGNATYKAMLVDTTVTGDFRGRPGGIALLIDVNGNGIFDRRGEFYDTALPFNIKGTTYQITGMSASGETFKVERSRQTVPEVPPPPDLRPGHKAPEFEAKTLDGKTIKFPSAFKGKIILLIFYATWCGDCRQQVPKLAKLYETYHGQGVEALGISLDMADGLPQLTQFTKENSLSWPQVYEGKWWQGDLAQLYFIQAIPTVGIIDGESGEVIAFGDINMTTTEVEGILQKALAKKK